ncbi:TRAP transporter small permease [Anianabacter salinae]|uniref:TRAP transporter small permease n=1 Tax=Anianabacter salinae TaxID=2851023 RepID=UPI00225E15F8|nr:TRAP transporter small permease [Anianabacter salinae]MBV0914269.1 TRAP transporter small permease [Anianabacter salinae]
MRALLDGLYIASGRLAAFFLLMIAVTIVAQIAGRMVGVTIDSTESGGFFLAGTTFLGMAYTLKTGGHVRVTLLVSRLPLGMARAADIAVTAFAAFGCACLTWQTAVLVHDSWRFGDLSPGLLAVPFWIPQSAMLAGLCVLTIALLDELTLLLVGREPGFAVPQETALDGFEHID